MLELAANYTDSSESNNLNELIVDAVESSGTRKKMAFAMEIKLELPVAVATDMFVEYVREKNCNL